MALEIDIEPMLSRLYEAALDPALWPDAWAEATAAAGATFPSLIVVADSGGAPPLAMPGWGRHALKPASGRGAHSFSQAQAGGSPTDAVPANTIPAYSAQASPAQASPAQASPAQANPAPLHASTAIMTTEVPVRSRAAKPAAGSAAFAQSLDLAEPLDHPAPSKRSAAADLDCSARLAPHLRRAVQVRARLAIARIVQAASAAALQAAETGVVLVTVGGRIVYADPTAQRLAGIVGLQLESVRGGLQAPSPEATAHLHSLVHDAAAGGAGGDMLMRAAEGSAVAVGVSALQWADPDADDLDPAPVHDVLQPLGPAVPQIVVTLRRLTQALACPRRVASLFGLTRSEADVAVAIAAGQPVAVVAAERGVSANTIQAQVRSAIVKTGVPGMQALALLFARLG